MAWKQIPCPPDRDPAPGGPERLALEGSALRVAFDASTGRIVEIASRATGAPFLAPGCVGGTFRLYDTRGLWIDGAAERATRVRQAGPREVEVVHERPRQCGVTFPVRVVLRYRLAEDGSLWARGRLTHLGGEAIVERFQFPVLSGLAEFEGEATQLLLPFIGGETRPAPLSGDWGAFEYIYPNEAMSFAALFGARDALYFASHDPQFRWTVLRGRVARRRRPPELEILFETAPFLREGETFETQEFVLAREAGGWHAAADRYRRWIETWYRPPDVPERVRRFRGLIELMFAYRDAGGRAVARDPDALHAYALRCHRELGLDIAHICGYHEGGFDARYPLYHEVLRSIGGGEGLKRFVRRCRDTPGLTTDIYINARITDIDTAWWGETGRAWACTSKDGTAFTESYNHRRFTVACPAIPARRAWWLEQAERFVRDWGIEGLQVDQPHTTARPCWSFRAHGHRSPFDHWASGFAALFAELRRRLRAIRPGFWSWGESASDFFSPFFDYSCIYTRDPEERVSFGETDPATREWVFDPRGFGRPEVFRYVCPEIPVLQCPRGLPEAPDDAMASLNLLWAFGAIVYWPGNRIEYDLDRVPLGLRRHLRRLYDAREGAPEALIHGRFRDTIGLATAPDAIHAKLYITPGEAPGIAVAAVNRDRGRARTAEIAVDPAALGIDAAGRWAWAERGAAGGEARGEGLAARVRVPGNGAALVTFARIDR